MGKYVMNEFDYRDIDSRFKTWMDRKHDALKFNALSLSWELDAWEEVEEKVKQRLENKIKNNNDALRLLEIKPDSEKPDAPEKGEAKEKVEAKPPASAAVCLVFLC